MTPVYRPTTDELRVDALCTANTTSMCGGRHHLDAAAGSLSVYLPIFIASRLLVGVGTAPVISIGVTYIDDCSSKEKFAKYAGQTFTCVCGGYIE